MAGILAGMAVLAFACEPAPSPSTGPSPAGSSTASPEPSIVATAALPTPVPSAAGPAALRATSDRPIVRLRLAGDIGGPVVAMVLYDDGTWLDPRSWPVTGHRLSAAGIAATLARIRDTGLFGESRSIPPPPVDHGFTTFLVELAEGDHTISVSATNAGQDAESRALVALADDLTTPATWLPDEAFEDGSPARRPYVPDQVTLTSEVADLPADAWVNTAHTIDRIRWPLATPPEALGVPITIEGKPNRALRCGAVDGATGADIQAALAGIEADLSDGYGRRIGWYIWLPGPALLRLTLHVPLPEEPVACGESSLPGPPRLSEAPRPSLATLLAASAGGVTPSGGAPLLFVIAHAAGGTQGARVEYFADGTILFHEAPAPVVGIGALRLSPAGMDQVTATLDASGLMGQSYSEDQPEGARYDWAYSIVSDTVVLTGTDRGVDPTATAIAALAAKLVDPAAWLPPTGFVDSNLTLQQYRPARVRITLYRELDRVDAPAHSVAGLAWPLSSSITSFGNPSSSVGQDGARRGYASPERALEAILALDAAGAERSAGGPIVAEYRLADVEPGWVWVFEFWIGPDED